ncbi:MAG TPA: DUF4012 domain-containing protein [Chloroflexota bacterium]|nr:DUF4012 domain-containing protein [Chloroflexota bacterium]
MKPVLRALRGGLVVLLALYALSGLAIAIAGWRIAAGARRVQAILTAPPGATIPWTALRATGREVRVATRVIQVASLPWRPLLAAGARAGALPQGAAEIGPLLDFAAPLADVGDHVLAAAETVARQLDIPSGGVPGAGAQPIAARLTRGLDAAAGDFAALRQPLASAARARGAIDTARLSGSFAPAARALDAYDRTLAGRPAVVELLAAAPEAWRWLAGEDGPRTFRVLGQNRDELRATGGFLASAAEATVQRGIVTRVLAGNPAELDDSSRSPTEPPRPLREFMGLGSWLLQDANWWADFPTSAAQADSFWRGGAPNSGTLAADDGALIRLTGALGPLRLPSIPEPVTAQNLPDLIATNVYAGALTHAEGIAIQERKSAFLSELFSSLLGAALDPPADKRAPLARAVLEAFEQKELLLTLSEPRLAAALAELGWDGHLSRAEGDLLYLVENTVSYTKLARRMQTELAYDVQLDERAAVRRAQLTLRVRNAFSAREVPSMYPSFYFGIWWNPATRREETHLGRYAGYYRVYVPEGTVLLGGAGWDAPLDYVPRESGRAAIGGYLIVDPGQTREVSLDLVPPGSTSAVAGGYLLTIPRQPSAPPRDVRLRVTLPAGLRAGVTVTGAGVLSGPSTQVPPVAADAAGRTALEWRGAPGSDVTLNAAVAFAG